ncbi:MAG: hypothetical protein RLZZ522_1420 [Verrucomicrobiota bacterium]|jgi:hypothetical protein
MPAKKIATTPPAAPVKNAAAKAAPAKTAAATKTPAKKATAKKAATAKPAAVPPASATRPSREQIERAAYLNYRDRDQKGLAGDPHSDWTEAEAKLKTL